MPAEPDAEFSPGQSLYLRAFQAILHDRQYAGLAGVPMPLPYLVISQYARDHRLPSDEFPMFIQMVRALDDEWREHLARRAVPNP